MRLPSHGHGRDVRAKEFKGLAQTAVGQQPKGACLDREVPCRQHVRLHAFFEWSVAAALHRGAVREHLRASRQCIDRLSGGLRVAVERQLSFASLGPRDDGCLAEAGGPRGAEQACGGSPQTWRTVPLGRPAWRCIRCCRVGQLPHRACMARHRHTRFSFLHLAAT
jgi:hypothetical protein